MNLFIRIKNVFLPKPQIDYGPEPCCHLTPKNLVPCVFDTNDRFNCIWAVRSENKYTCPFYRDVKESEHAY